MYHFIHFLVSRASKLSSQGQRALGAELLAAYNEQLEAEGTARSPKPAREKEGYGSSSSLFFILRTRPTRTVDHRGMGEPHVRAEDLDRQAIIVTSKKA